MSKEMGDVWELETADEGRAAQDLEGYAEVALHKGREGWWARDYLVRLWGEEWASIETKLETEGSVWYVWWMDGVRKHLAQSRKRVGRAT